MKFWPTKKWKQVILVVIIAFFVIVAGVMGFVLYKINSDYVSDTKTLNPDGLDTALIIYHPGLSSFIEDCTYAYADGLVANGWRVEITTASSHAPTDLSKFGLLVLGSPVYAGKPSDTIQRHVERVGDLQGKNVVLLVTSGGSDGIAEALMQQTVEAHSGSVLAVVSLFNDSPNPGNADPLELAEQAGNEVFI